jgi:GAF domain-containing protein
MRRVLEDGPQLMLRPAASCSPSGVAVVGSRTRLSASLLCVPVVVGHRTAGFLSIRSSLENAYHVEDMETLQMVAAQCAGALERIEARPEREDNVVSVPAAVSAVAAEASP